MSRKINFYLPPKGTIEPNGKDDPLKYYYHPLVGFLYRGRIKQALSLLNPPYESILEVGYGSGILLPTLFSMAKRVCGVDMNSDPAGIEGNLDKLGVRASLTKADIFSVDYSKESFDLIVAISIFEHICDLRPVLERLSAFLRPDGHLLVGIPRVDSFMKTAFSLIGFRNIEDYHVTGYSKFVDSSKNIFRLIKFSRMPSWAPKNAALYFNMLFSKL